LNGNDFRANSPDAAYGFQGQSIPYPGAMGSAFNTTAEPFQYAMTGLNGNEVRASTPEAPFGFQGQTIPYPGAMGSAYSTTPQTFEYAATGLNGNDFRANSPDAAYGFQGQTIPYPGAMGSAYSTTPQPFEYGATGLNGNDFRANQPQAPAYNDSEPAYAQNLTGGQPAATQTTAADAQLDMEIASNDYHDYASDLAGTDGEGGTAPV
jgi:hypothetical protein